MEHGKDLPSLILSSTSVSCLVTLIPILVSMTSNGERPRYNDETDKPDWWPSDIKWRNPRFYIQHAERKDDGLKVLRKLVYSCYSYHGVEDLLCRSDETTVSDSETELENTMEIIELEDDIEETTDSLKESEGPVFVCCFCLDQFNSHELVNSHQSSCAKRFSKTINGSPNVKHINNKLQNQETKDVETVEEDLFAPFLGQATSLASQTDDASGIFENVITSSSRSSPEKRNIHLSKASEGKTGIDSIPPTCSISSYPSCNSLQSLSSSTITSQKQRPAINIPSLYAPVSKTRSQRKLEQIMEKHHSRRLMLKECREMKDVPRDGAWWSRKNRRRKKDISDHCPYSTCSQNSFMSALGLAQTTVVAAMANKEQKPEQEVDLDCQITSVEGPLSLIAITRSPSVMEKPLMTSPRSTRSLMSQLSHDGEVNTRRKLSFCFVEDEWADKQAMDEGRDPLQISLLTLEFSSPLGQRIKKYVRGEGHLNIIKDIESYCKTEEDDDGYSKLRYRGYDFRITYRKKKRASNYVHTYKFNKFDRKEFKKLLKTGLNANSRHLLKSLPVCRVVLKRLNDSNTRLRTEEKKFTISENIVFDDDICITHIDIPQRKVHQGSTTDITSHPQHQLYRPLPQFRPSSPLSTGRLPTTLDHKSFSPRMSASPPHVPNIFRSRTSQGSPLPRLGPVRSQNVSPGWRSPQQVQNKPRNITAEEDRVKNVIAEEITLKSGNPNSANNNSNNNEQIKTSERTDQNPLHLSGHKCLSPSPYTNPDKFLAEPKCSPDVSSASNRRKQQLTHVRNDEGEGVGVAHEPAPINRSYTSPSSHNTHNNSNRKGFVENHHNNVMQKKHEPIQNHHTNSMLKKHEPSSSAFVSQTLGPSMRRLSNFDYFSIRDGKIQPSYPQHSHAVVSQQQRHQPSVPTAHQLNHQDLRPSRQNFNSSGPNHQNQRPPLSQSSNHKRHNSHHPLHSREPQPFTGQTRPNSHSSHQNLSGPRNGMHERSTLSLKNHINNTPMQTAKRLTPKFLPLCQNKFDDDDVMEIICIDDD